MTTAPVAERKKSGLRFRLWCLLNRHRPPDRRANWDGEQYISRCAHCRKPIRRTESGRWVIDRRRERLSRSPSS